MSEIKPLKLFFVGLISTMLGLGMMVAKYYYNANTPSYYKNALWADNAATYLYIAMFLLGICTIVAAGIIRTLAGLKNRK